MFKQGDRVSFGIRQHWTGKFRPSIPRYTGEVFIVDYPFKGNPIIWVSCPEYSNKNIAFTQRKNGNWVRKGDADDNYRGYSRVALQLDGQPWRSIKQNQQLVIA
jgi:hypothetical protein